MLMWQHPFTYSTSSHTSWGERRFLSALVFFLGGGGVRSNRTSVSVFTWLEFRWFWPRLGSPLNMGVPHKPCRLFHISSGLEKPTRKLTTFVHICVGRSNKSPATCFSSWWLNQPIWKICKDQIGSSPQVKMKIKNVWVATRVFLFKKNTPKTPNPCLQFWAISYMLLDGFLHFGGGLSQLPWGLTDGLSRYSCFSKCLSAPGRGRAIDDAILDDTVDGSEILHQLIW